MGYSHLRYMVSWFMYCEYTFTLCSNPNCQQCFEKSFASYKDIDQYWSEINKVQPRQVLKKTKNKSNQVYYIVCCKCNCTCGVYPEYYHDNWECHVCQKTKYIKPSLDEPNKISKCKVNKHNIYKCCLDEYDDTNKYLNYYKPRSNLSTDVFTQNNLCNNMPSKNNTTVIYNNDF